MDVIQDFIMKKLFCSLILILAILLAGCAGTTTSAAAPTAAPTHASAPGIVTASVNVVPVDKSNLAFIISGPVKQVDVTEGDQVKAGQTLVALDTPDLAFAVSGAQADLRSAQDYAFLQNYFRKTLIGSNWVSTNGAPELRQMAAAKVQKAQAALDSAQAALNQATLLAPYAGTVVSINVTPGEHVQSGQVVAVIADLTHLQIETKDLSEREIASVQIGQKASIRLKSFAQDLTGQVIKIAQMSSIYNGDNVFKVTIQLDSQPTGLLWGMSGDVDIHTQ
jgi:RND family efflux transporter MFP subunit